jgi:hypothetical protein
MKIAPVTVTEIVIVGGVVVLGVLAYRAWTALPKTPGAAFDVALSASANAVDRRDVEGSELGAAQSWVDSTVRKGQEAGASTFVSSFFTGLFK